MSHGVCGVFKLAEAHGTGDRREKLVCLVGRTFHAELTRSIYQLCAECAHKRLFFDGEFCGNDENHAVALVERGKCDAESRISGGGFDYRGALFQFASFLRILDEILAEAVFDAAGGVPEFQLCEKIDAFFDGEMIESEHGGVADKLMNVLINSHFLKCPFSDSACIF